jgi:hypothetical protein
MKMTGHGVSGPDDFRQADFWIISIAFKISLVGVPSALFLLKRQHAATAVHY